MKKFSFLFVVLALMSLVCSAFADDFASTLPQIDEKEDADFLGIWYLDTTCIEGFCIPLGESNTTLELKADNTATHTDAEGESSTDYWFVKDGVAYSVSGEEQEDIYQFPFTLEDGALVFGDKEMSVTFVREITVKEEATPVAAGSEEDFLGEWKLFSMGDNEMMIEVTLFGMEGDAVINKDGTMTISFDGEVEEGITWTFEDGKITAIEKNQETGEEETFLVEKLSDGSMRFTQNYDKDDVVMLVFFREEEMPKSEFDIMSLLNALVTSEADEESSDDFEMSDEDWAELMAMFAEMDFEDAVEEEILEEVVAEALY